LGDVNVGERIILKLILKKEDRVHLAQGKENWQRIVSLAAEISTSQEGLLPIPVAVRSKT
jgi:hypothetical protein